jgi:cytochrome P450
VAVAGHQTTLSSISFSVVAIAGRRETGELAMETVVSTLAWSHGQGMNTTTVPAGSAVVVGW